MKLGRVMTYKEFLQTGFWAGVKLRKLELNPCCERCESRKFLHVHHVRYRASWYDVQLEDLQTLCGRCHRRHHGKTLPKKGPSMNEVGRIRAIRRKLKKINKSVPRGKSWRWVPASRT